MSVTTERPRTVGTPPPGVVGTPTDRVDGRRKVQGEAEYAADAPVRDVLYAALVRATIARGTIATLDDAKARALDDVVRIFSHLDPPSLTMPTPDFTQALPAGEEHNPLQDARIHYAGQYVAMVVARTLEAALAGADLVELTYNAESPKIGIAANIGEAYEPDHDITGNNPQYARGDLEAALASADVRIEAGYLTPQVNHNPMEPHATVAVWNDGMLTLHESTQWVVGTRNVIAKALGLEPERVRVLSPFVGGGFGCKGFVWAHAALAAAAARELERPVKLVLGRDAMFTGVGHRARTEQRLRIGAKRDGAIVAIDHVTTAHTSEVSDFLEPAGLTTRFLYAHDAAIRVVHRLVHLNVSTPNPMRAPGETPGTFALESAMDELAYALAVDPIELRRRNEATHDAAQNRPWSGRHLLECYEVGARRFGWSKRTPEPRSMRSGNELVGYGVATATYPGYRAPANAHVEVRSDGHAVVGSATHDLGTGMYTIMTQVVAERLGIALDNVEARLGDTQLPPAPVAGGSMSAASVLPAIAQACDEVRRQAIEVATTRGDSPLAGLSPNEIEIASGRLYARGEPERGIAYGDVLRLAGATAFEALGAADPGDSMQKQTVQSFGAQFCEVRYDEEIGRLRVARHLGVFDCGAIVNPKTARSQMIGGIVWGIGMALMEETVLDPRTGAVVTNNLADYHVPTCADVPEIDVAFVEHPDYAFNALGIRGVGEIGITGVAAAIANAVYHATGKRLRDVPFLPETLLEPVKHS